MNDYQQPTLSANHKTKLASKSSNGLYGGHTKLGRVNKSGNHYSRIEASDSASRVEISMNLSKAEQQSKYIESPRRRDRNSRQNNDLVDDFGQRHNKRDALPAVNIRGSINSNSSISNHYTDAGRPQFPSRRDQIRQDLADRRKKIEEGNDEIKRIKT